MEWKARRRTLPSLGIWGRLLKEVIPWLPLKKREGVNHVGGWGFQAEHHDHKHR